MKYVLLENSSAQATELENMDDLMRLGYQIDLACQSLQNGLNLSTALPLATKTIIMELQHMHLNYFGKLNEFFRPKFIECIEAMVYMQPYNFFMSKSFNAQILRLVKGPNDVDLDNALQKDPNLSRLLAKADAHEAEITFCQLGLPLSQNFVFPIFSELRDFLINLHLTDDRTEFNIMVSKRLQSISPLTCVKGNRKFNM